MPSKLVCKYCWIGVEPIPVARTIGKGPRYDYKHKSMRDDSGQPFCGRVQLGENDVEYANPIDEEALLNA